MDLLSKRGNMFGTIGFQEIIIIVVVILFLFGAKRIPELMKSVGKGIREMKQGLSVDIDEELENKK
jgi:sec-independent protein translocase protein TatA